MGAARELSKLGFVTVAAPREQHSGAGRSVPAWSDGEIKPTILTIGDQEWTCYAVGGSPAQAVQYGILAILKQKPDLVVSGINYGENPATDITLSGTVGAALEAAAHGIPALQSHLNCTTRITSGIRARPISQPRPFLHGVLPVSCSKSKCRRM